MTAKSVLVRPQDLRPGARAPTCPPWRHCLRRRAGTKQEFKNWGLAI